MNGDRDTRFGAGKDSPLRRSTVLFFALALCAPLLHGQASPTASRAGDLQVGGGFSSAASDYGRRFNGGFAYFDFDFRQHFGIEGNFHFVKQSNYTLYEKTYEIGGRYLRTYGNFVPYGKVMYGRGVFNFPPCPPPADQSKACANLAYNLYALGAGVDYKLNTSIHLRGDFEYQRWPGFPPTGLTPVLISVGAAYHFH